MFEVEGYQFSSTQSVLVEQGWEVLHTEEKDAKSGCDEFDLATLKSNTATTCVKSEVEQKETKPPNSSIFAKEKVWRTTKQSQELCAALPNEIIKPDISAIWAEKPAFVKTSEMSVEDFIADVGSYITERIDDLDENGINITLNTVPCPSCSNPLYRLKGQHGWFCPCSGYPKCDKAYPDLQGKPDFRSRVKPVVSAHKCPTCNKGLIRRKPPKEKRKYFWACSGYPNCTTMTFDRKGPPNNESAKSS
ncbi:topoisomerase DNA-binding C4 zinc finger domain-containing protein [Vibrio harveyi]|uniref:topoisomerase DNA-binding C4 zinc finger domain-containing protein n=1 Tax=Vibrio harveyi TaxID=669 RepID=UPI001EEF084C|nr:topoisomerase DNA-binding C4 zinc finger domain-containing protein [Vibrio harveyi]